MSVVVVSYNTKTLTLQCLESLCRNVPEGTEVCVVDNASVDNSATALQEFARTQATPVRVLSAHRNLGFGAANNLGAGSTSGEFIALVNSDAFVREGVLHGLREYLRRTPKAAAVGPLLENVDGSFQESRFPFPTPARAWVENLGLARLGRCFKPKKPLISGPVQWLSGACLLIRRTVWERIGGFDEHFFLYAEETDLQRRIADKGWEIHWAPDFVVTHIGGSSGLAEREAVREHFFAGADRYIQRYHGILGVWMFRTATCTGAVLRWVWSLWRGGRGGTAAMRWAWILRRQISRPLPKDFGPPAGCSLAPATADSPRRGESPTE